MTGVQTCALPICFPVTIPGVIARLTFVNKRGELIELQQFADIHYGIGATALERTNRISSITIKSNVIGRAAGTVGAEIQAAYANKLPDGVEVVTSGMMEQQESAFGSLGFAFIAAIVLIYLIMVMLYNSLTDPLVVLFSIPLAMIGAILALALTMKNLDIFSIIGIIVLIGLVAKNAILLVDFANHLRKEGLGLAEAVIEAGRERIRPILMTTFSMIFGMLPIALAAGNGAEMKNGMAWVIIGGLTSSMILTLVVVPVIYYIFKRIGEKNQDRTAGKTARSRAGRQDRSRGSGAPKDRPHCQCPWHPRHQDRTRWRHYSGRRSPRPNQPGHLHRYQDRQLSREHHPSALRTD